MSGTTKKKPKATPHYVGVVTISAVAETAPRVKTTYESRIGFAAKDMTPQRRKEIAERMKAEIKEYFLKNREAYGIKSETDVKFYAGVKILECDGITRFANGTDT